MILSISEKGDKRWGNRSVSNTDVFLSERMVIKGTYITWNLKYSTQLHSRIYKHQWEQIHAKNKNARNKQKEKRQ